MKARFSMKTPPLFVAIVLSVTMFLHIPPAAADDSAYLKVWVNRDRADTYSAIEIRLESKVWVVNQTGNSSLVWNNGTMAVTVTAMDDNLVIERRNVTLGEGRGVFWLQVKPEWTSSLVNITALDTLTGLTGSAELYTEMSDEYMLWMIGNSYRSWTERQITAEAQEDFNERAMLAAFALCSFALAFMIFIRMEHRLATSQNRLSLWDRFTEKISISLTDENENVNAWLDTETTWDRRASDSFNASRAESQCKMIDSEIEDLERQKERLRIVET